MSSYQEESFAFVVTLVKEYPDLLPSKIIKGVIKLLLLVDHYQRLAVKDCNEQLTDNERLWLDKTLEYKILHINEIYFDNKLVFDFTGDPRGICIKLKLPSGYINNELYCMPVHNY